MPEHHNLTKIDLALSKFHKLYRKNRSFKRFEQLSGINLERQSQKNIVDLYHRLKQAQGLPIEIINSIQNEKNRSDDALTPKELDFFKVLLDIPIIGNHATHNLAQIQASDHQVYSAQELSRRKINVYTHTPPHQGEDDFVFLSYHHPQKVNIVNFVGAAHVLFVNLDNFATFDPITYSSMWTSGHFYAYDQEQQARPVYYQTQESMTKVSTHYHVEFNPVVSYVRTHSFQSGDVVDNQSFPREEEISVGRHIKPYHILRLIEYIRHLAPESRKHILDHPEDKNLLADLFDSVFTPGKSELHVPVVLQFSGGKEIFAIKHSNQIEYRSTELFACIDRGDERRLEDYLNHNISLQSYTKDFGELTEVSLLHYAVLKKNWPIVRLLLRYGANPDSTYTNTRQVLFLSCAQRRSLQDAIEENDFELIKTLCEPLQNKQKSMNISYGANVTTLDMFTAIAYKSDRTIFSYLLKRYIHGQGSPGQLIFVAILYDNMAALESILQTGCSSDETIEVKHTVDNAHLIPLNDPSTALCFAAYFGRVDAVKCLLKYGVDVNAYIKEIGDFHQYGRGDSALMRALSGLMQGGVQPDSLGFGSIHNNQYASLGKARRANYLAILNVLLNAGADPFYINGEGHQFYRQCADYLKDSEVKDLDLSAILNNLVQDEQRIAPEPNPERMEYGNKSRVLITGTNEHGDICLLVGKDYKRSTYQFPGGAVNYTLDADFKEAAIHLTAYITGINLREHIESSHPIRMEQLTPNKHTILEIFHYALQGSAAEYRILANTINSDRFERKRDLQGVTKLKDIELIPIRDIGVTSIQYQHITYPVCTYRGKALPPYAAPLIAALCGVSQFNTPEVHGLSIQLYNSISKLLNNDLVMNDLDAIKRLLALGIKEYVDLSSFIAQALNSGHYSIVYYLLEEGVHYGNYQVLHFFQSNIRGKSHPEEVVQELFIQHQHMMDRYTLIAMAELMGQEGYASIIEMIVRDDLELITACVNGAAKSGRSNIINKLLETVPDQNKEVMVCDLVDILSHYLDKKNSQAKNQEVAELFCKLASEYKGEERRRLMLIRINSFFEEMIVHHISESCVNQLLLTLSRLIAKKEFAHISKFTGTYGVYYRLSNKAIRKDPERCMRYREAAERYFDVFKNQPIFQLECAGQNRDAKTIDALIDKYHQRPEIRLWTIRNEYVHLNCDDEAGNSCFQRAVKSNAVHRVAFLLSTTTRHYGFNINETDSDGCTVLTNAIELGHQDIARLLITHGAEVDRRTLKLAYRKQLPQLAEFISLRLKHRQPEEKKMNDFNLIISPQSPLEQDNLAQTGDVDYARSIAAEMQNLTTGRVQYCNTNTKQILDEQLKSNPHNTVFHLMVNAPRTGFALDLPYLEHVKEAGCRIIMTAVEFAKHVEKDYKVQTLNYLQHAEHIIFLDEQDKNEALSFASKQMPKLIGRLKQAQVISVPPTISPQYITREKTNAHIMCFGMLRTGKGMAHVTHLAEIIKNSTSPYLQDKKIFVVGTVQSHKTRKGETAYDAELFKLLTRLYPQYKDQFFNKSPDELVALYQGIKHEEPDLPIKLFLNVPESELPHLFKQCEYAIYSAYRGVTLRNSSISTELGFGCIIYSFEGEITPSCLRKDGPYRDAMVILTDNHYHRYANNIAEDITFREKDKKKSETSYERHPSLNTRTRQLAYNLLTYEISLSGVAAKHQAVYQKLFVASQASAHFPRFFREEISEELALKDNKSYNLSHFMT